jgi:hypothetical protein
MMTDEHAQDGIDSTRGGNCVAGIAAASAQVPHGVAPVTIQTLSQSF